MVEWLGHTFALVCTKVRNVACRLGQGPGGHLGAAQFSKMPHLFSFFHIVLRGVAVGLGERRELEGGGSAEGESEDDSAHLVVDRQMGGDDDVCVVCLDFFGGTRYVL